jgi:hypothetical protein
MFVKFFKSNVIQGKTGTENLFDIKHFIKNAVQKATPDDITKFSVFDILEPESKTIKIIEKLAVVAAISEVVAVITKLVGYKYYEHVVYGSLYSSVVVTVLLPIAKFFDSTSSYKKLLKDLRENPLDRALVLSFLLGACSIIGKDKMLELQMAQRSFTTRIKNKVRNFWDNTKIHGNFSVEFEDIFGHGSFDVFLNIIDGLDDKHLDIKDIHDVVAPFFNSAELWNNKKVTQVMRVLNYKSKGVKVDSNKEIISSLDYLLLTYFKYGKTDVMHDIERFYIKKSGRSV